MAQHHNLHDLTYVELKSVLKHCAGGSVGFCVERDERTKTKDKLIQHIFGTYAASLIVQAIENVEAEQAAEYVEAEEIAPKPAKAAPVAAPAAPAPAVALGFDALLQGIVMNQANAAIEAGVSKHLEAAGEAFADMLRRYEANNLAPRRVVLEQAGRAPVAIDGAHPLIEKCLKLLGRGQNVMLVGPAGCGKTTLARQCSEALGVGFHRVPYTAGASESWLLGRLLPTGEGGRFEYQSSKALDYWHGPGLTLHDEFDAADPNMALILNGLTDNGHFSNPLTNVLHTRHAQAFTMGACNTFGTGADIQYVGRNQLDEATRDRWYFLAMDYDRALEKQIAIGLLNGDRKTADHVCKFVWSVRDKILANKLHRTASTRLIEKFARLMADDGFGFDAIKADVFAGWTEDEKAAVGVGA